MSLKSKGKWGPYPKGLATALGAVGLLMVCAWAPGRTVSADTLPVVLNEELIEGAGPGVLKESLPAYQLAAFEMTLHHWRMMLGQRPLVTDDALQAVREVFMRSDPTSGARVPPAIRRPMGPLVDLYHIWSARPIFDAARITVPVLVIRGDADFFAEPGLAAKLTGAPRKEEVVIKDATHWVLYEKHRDRLLSATEEFLKR